MIAAMTLRLAPIAAALMAVTAMDAASAELPAAGDPYAARKVFYEEHWQRKIESALSYVPDVVVAVNVELSPVIDRRESATQLDRNAVARVKRESSTKNTTDQAAEADGELAKAAAEDESYVEYAVPETRVETHLAGLVPQRVTASISVPSTYCRAVWRSRNAAAAKGEDAPPSDDDLQAIQEEMHDKIEATVAILLPRRAGEDHFLGVRVICFDNLRAGEGPHAAVSNTHDAFAINDVLSVDLKDAQDRGLGYEVPARMAVRIVDVRPNGDYVIHGRTVQATAGGSININLKGVVGPETVRQDRSVTSDAVVDFSLKTQESQSE